MLSPSAFEADFLKCELLTAGGILFICGSPMPGMLKGLEKCLMNESMNTMADWINEEWKDRGMAGGDWVDE